MRILAVVASIMPAVLALAGCSGDEEAAAPQAIQPPAPNSSYMAFATAGGQRKLYVPSTANADGTALAVVNAAAPHGTSALLKFIDLGPGVAPYAVGADGDDVVAVDGSNPTVWFISASSDTVRATAALPAGSEKFRISGANIYSGGAAVDAARRRAWVSASTGIVEYDLDTHAVTASYPVPAPENFAYDPVSRRLIVPFYLCDPVLSIASCVPYEQPGGPAITDSLSVIDLASGVSYTLVNPDAPDAHAPVGFRPDAVAIDGSTGRLFVTIEAPPTLAALDVAALTADASSLTCQIPSVAVIDVPAKEYGVVSVDPNTQIAVVAQEMDAGIAFVDVSSAGAGAMPALFFAMPPLPTGDPWNAREDPHGIAIGVIDGHPYAFLSDFSREWVARIDLRTIAEMRLSGSRAALAGAVAYLHVPPLP